MCVSTGGDETTLMNDLMFMVSSLPVQHLVVSPLMP